MSYLLPIFGYVWLCILFLKEKAKTLIKIVYVCVSVCARLQKRGSSWRQSMNRLWRSSAPHSRRSSFCKRQRTQQHTHTHRNTHTHRILLSLMSFDNIWVFLFVFTDSHPLTSFPQQHGSYQPERVQANVCFHWDMWSEPPRKTHLFLNFCLFCVTEKEKHSHHVHELTDDHNWLVSQQLQALSYRSNRQTFRP